MSSAGRTNANLGLPNSSLTGPCESEPDLRNFHYVGRGAADVVSAATMEDSTGGTGIEDIDDYDDEDDEEEDAEMREKRIKQEAELSAAMLMAGDSIQPVRCSSFSSVEEALIADLRQSAYVNSANVSSDWINCLDDHDHFEKQYVDTIVPFPVDELFTLLFTDSAWCRNFFVLRKTSDVQLPAWPEQCDPDGTKSRVVTYTLALNYPIGPKVSHTVEKQMLLACSKPGHIMVLNTEVENRGIPYAGNFYVFNRYCLTAAGSDSSRIRVCSKVMYTKTVFMMAKSMIESSAKNGLNEYFRMMLSLLNTEAAERQKLWAIDNAATLTSGSAPSPVAQNGSATSNVRRRRVTPFCPAVSPNESELPSTAEVGGASSNNIEDVSKAEQAQVGAAASRLWLSYNNAVSADRDRLIAYLLIGFALALFVCFATLYSRLKELETLIEPLTSEHLQDNLKHMDQEQWQQLLSEQRKLQQKELLRWRDILDSTINTLHHMRNALLRLRSQIDLESS